MRSVGSLALRIVLPVAIGFAIIYFMFGSEIADMSFDEFPVTDATILGLTLTFILVASRQFGLLWRFNSLTDYKLGWASSLKVSMICDFTSAITPTSAGGSILSMIFLNKEGINLGRATAITMVTLFLDQCYYIVIAPVMFYLAGPSEVFKFTDSGSATGLATAFWLIYAGFVIIALMLYVGIFHNPQLISRLLCRIFSWRLLRRWSSAVAEMGENLVTTSADIRRQNFRWWISPIISTILLWSSRFLIVNAIFYAFFPGVDQLTVLARQLVVWGLLLFMPTPGGSGVSEVLFKTYYADIVGGPLLALLAIVWRVATYYIYLVGGVIIIPLYLKLNKYRNEYEQCR